MPESSETPPASPPTAGPRLSWGRALAVASLTLAGLVVLSLLINLIVDSALILLFVGALGAIASLLTGLAAGVLLIRRRERIGYPLAALAGVLLSAAYLTAGFVLITWDRRLCTETMAALALERYAAAQADYDRWHGGEPGQRQYATPYTALLSDPTSLRSFSQVGKSYVLRDCMSIAGKPIDGKKDFALCATPALYGQPCRRTFIVRTDGVVWAKDLGRVCLIDDFPDDPAGKGWQRALGQERGPAAFP